MAGIVWEMNTTKGFVHHKTFIQTMQEFPDYAGYLYTNDYVVLNPYQLATCDEIKIWKHVHAWPKDVQNRSLPPPPTDFGTDRCPAKARCGTTPRASQLSSTRIMQFTGIPGQVDVRSFCDAVYIPARISTGLIGILQRLLEHNVFLKMGVGLVLVAIKSTEEWVN